MCKEMEEPCLCDHCKELFDLQDGWVSEKWYENIVICEKCYKEEKKEIELDDEISELNEVIESALFDLKDAQKRLAELGVSYKDYFPSNDDIKKAGEESWEENNDQLKNRGGVNSHAFLLGFNCCGTWYKNKLINHDTKK